MNETEIFDQVKAVFIENAGLEPHEVFLDAKFSDLELDSLDALTIVSDLEEKFDIIIPDESVADIETVHDVVQSVINTIKTKSV